jgi:hypothetical protein
LRIIRFSIHQPVSHFPPWLAFLTGFEKPRRELDED